MPAPRIPNLALIGDTIAGVVIAVDDHFLLTTEAIDGHDSVHHGTFTVRYGITYLGKPHKSLVPGLMALDYGAFKTGEEAWDFLLNKSNLYPRADVLGYDAQGEKQQVFVKELDLLYPFDVLVYGSEDEIAALCEVDAFIGVDDGLTDRLKQNIRVFETVEKWREAINNDDV
ncbi:MAG: hypothetical protein AAFQ07_14030 [Chloroflexota bacterium]